MPFYLNKIFICKAIEQIFSTTVLGPKRPFQITLLSVRSSVRPVKHLARYHYAYHSYEHVNICLNK